MTINPSPKSTEIFQAYREVLALVSEKEENNGTASSAPVVSHDEVFQYFFSNSPIHKEVIKYIAEKKASNEKITEGTKKNIKAITGETS